MHCTQCFGLFRGFPDPSLWPFPVIIIHHQGNRKYPDCDLLSCGENSGGGGWLVKENVNDDTCTAVQIKYADTNDYVSILKSVSLCACFVFVISTIWLLLYLFIAICFAKNKVGYFQQGTMLLGSGGKWSIRLLFFSLFSLLKLKVPSVERWRKEQTFWQNFSGVSLLPSNQLLCLLKSFKKRPTFARTFRLLSFTTARNVLGWK